MSARSYMSGHFLYLLLLFSPGCMACLILLYCTFNNVLCKIFVFLKKNVDICTINQSHINNL